FTKSLRKYEENAHVQKETAEQLINILGKKQYDSILEIGCSSGVLTKLIHNKINFKEFSAIDLVEESENYIKLIIPDSNFIAGDIETIKLDKKYDLIISNACLQWCNDIKTVINKLYQALNENGMLAITIFTDNNLPEIKSIFGIENTTYKISELKEHLKNYNVLTYKEELKVLYFETPIEVLNHIKLTGVNAVTDMKLTKSTLADFCIKYNQLYKTNKGVRLTYTPVYIVLSKSD
ncbi:MAG: malonyl-ACP O-methyltransferase BioC, partial [Candidatus Gastranaerophilales bacterium]|nr:malonyl-ACP O-methyltransferase BioC [Candidatus Gastranaerophilales bacterium]